MCRPMAKLSCCLPLTIWLTIGLAGCATRPPLPSLAPGPVAVVSARSAPQTNFDRFARGKAHAAGAYGAESAAEGAAAGAIVPLTTPAGIVAYPVIAPFTILAGALIGGAYGAAEGAAGGVSAEQAAELARVIASAVAGLQANRRVAEQVAARLGSEGRDARDLPEQVPEPADADPAYSALAVQGIAAVLELTVEKVGFAALKGNEPRRLSLEMHLRASTVNLAGEGEDGVEQLVYRSRPRTLAEWTSADGAALAVAFEEGYRVLAQRVIDTFF